MAFLEFAFQSFWHFIGVVILLQLVVLGIAAARGK